MPAGPEKHVTLIGGDVLGIPKGSTQEQIDAAFKWEEYSGISYSLTDAGKESILAGYEKKKSDGTLIGIKDLSIWKDSSERQKFVNETIDANININPNHIKSYNDKDGIDYQVEEPVCTQDLYKLLDGCIQEVLTNKDADCAALLKTASETFQSNFLDYE